MKKSERQKLNPYLAAALRAEGKSKLIKRIPEEGYSPYPLGITEEHYSDGSKRFTGPGGGVLWIHSDGMATVMRPEVVPPQRVRLLMEVAVKHMPTSLLEIGDIENFKGESLVLLEALRTRDAPFFRALADAIRPRPSALEIAKEHAESQWGKDNAVLFSIIEAVENEAKTDKRAFIEAVLDPTEDSIFIAILKEYRNTKHNSDETPSAFKKRLKVRGFLWLCGNSKKPRC